MYVMVLHEITKPELFWNKAQELLGAMPTDITLHQTFSTPDGTPTVCIWEAAGIERVQRFLAPAFAGLSTDTYFIANNKDGVTVPPRFAAMPVSV